MISNMHNILQLNCMVFNNIYIRHYYLQCIDVHTQHHDGNINYMIIIMHEFIRFMQLKVYMLVLMVHN